MEGSEEKMKKIILLLILIFLAVPVYGADYYTDHYNISGNCSDINPGTIDQPFCTISTGLGNVFSGDTLYIRDGTYNEKINITISGTSGSRITIKGYQNEIVILDGQSINDHGVYISGKNYITIENLRFQYFNATGALIENAKGVELKNIETSYNGIGLNITAADSIIIENISSSFDNGNYILNTNYSTAKNLSFKNGLGIYLVNLTKVGFENLTINDNNGEAVLKNSTGINLTNIQVYSNLGNLSIISSSDVAIINSTIYNNYGIILSSCNTTHIEKNRIYGNSNGIDVNNTYNTDFLENLIYDNNQNALKISESYNITLGRNTINNHLYGLYINYSNITAKGNIISSTYSLVLDSYSYSDSDYNILYGIIIYNDTEYNFADYKNITGYDNHSYGSNPLFIAENDFHLSVGSPAIDSGFYYNISDFDGIFAYDDTVNDTGYGTVNYSDIGAYEFTRPEIFIVSPADGDVFIDKNITFSFNVSDERAIDNCSLTLNGIVIENNYSIVNDQETNFTWSNPDGMSHNWSIKCYNKVSVYSEQNGTLRVIRLDKFDGNTTNLTGKNLSNLTDFVIEKTPYGYINFTESIDISQGADINKNVNISYNRVEVNMTELDKQAIVTFYGINFTNPKIMKDGQECGAGCTKISYANGTFVFSVAEFTVYTLEETPEEPPVVIPPSGGNGAGPPPPAYPGCSNYIKLDFQRNITIPVDMYWYISGKIKNTGNCPLNNITITLDLPGKWQGETIYMDNLAIGEEKEVYLRITPRNANVGRYRCYIVLNSGNYSARKEFEVLIGGIFVDEKLDTIRQYITHAESRIQEGISKGIDMSHAQQLLQQAIELYNKEDYVNAEKVVVEALNIAEEALDEYKPPAELVRTPQYFYLFVLFFSLTVLFYYLYKRIKKWKKYAKFRGLYVPFRTRGQ